MFVPADQTSSRRLNSRTNACWRAVRMKSESSCRSRTYCSASKPDSFW